LSYSRLGPLHKQLIEWVCASAKNRRTPWKDIPGILAWNCSVYAIQTAFKIEGFARRTALKKPILTEVHKATRLEWALEHIHWTQEQWDQILWTDETWVQPGKHKKIKVTRRVGEVLHPDCVEPKIQRKIGWMFWGSISGLYSKGPGIFWEKDWGSISLASYCQHIVPTVCRYCDQWRLTFMQDNASSHSSKESIAELRLRGLCPIFWPANSPNLNPIEALWDWMKDYIQDKYPEIHRSYPRLQEVVSEAWNSITNNQIVRFRGSEECNIIIQSCKRCIIIFQTNRY
jgi:transposase